MSTCHKKKNVLIDVHLEAYAPNWVARYGTAEQRAQELRDWTREFTGFVRDHRSQDAISLDVIEEREDICSVCGQQWETQIDDDGKLQCANCGAEVDSEEE